ncbi:hypothetical protein ACFWIA_27520 [Streptomyces sp. NPDC127068]|uniref:hypothetical protein n=1 Tax=Streptomyces sp. NPDC127068 TaxID=3347127 RepID=UPI00364C8D68
MTTAAFTTAATGILVTPSFANAPVPNPALPVSGTLTPEDMHGKDYDHSYGGNWNDKADAIKF